MNENIKSKILNAFSEMSAKVGHYLSDRWVFQNLMPSLNPNEREQLEATLDKMKQNDLITLVSKGGISAIALGQAGYDVIYPTTPEEAKAKIRAAILNRFSSAASKVGECIDERWIVHKLLPSLNPKEAEQVNPAIQEMKDDGLISIDKKMGMTNLILSQKGFDEIY